MTTTRPVGVSGRRVVTILLALVLATGILTWFMLPRPRVVTAVRMPYLLDGPEVQADFLRAWSAFLAHDDDAARSAIGAALDAGATDPLVFLLAGGIEREMGDPARFESLRAAGGAYDSVRDPTAKLLRALATDPGTSPEAVRAHHRGVFAVHLGVYRGDWLALLVHATDVATGPMQPGDAALLAATVERDPDAVLPWVLQGRGLLAAGDVDGAAEVVRHGLERHAGAPGLLALSARIDAARTGG